MWCANIRRRRNLLDVERNKPAEPRRRTQGNKMGNHNLEGPASPAWLIERSPIDPRRMRPGEFIEWLASEGEKFLISNPSGRSQWLWHARKGAYLLGPVEDRRADLPRIPLEVRVNAVVDRPGPRGATPANWARTVVSVDLAREAAWRDWLVRTSLPVVAIAEMGGAWLAWLPVGSSVRARELPAILAAELSGFAIDPASFDANQSAPLPSGAGDGVNAARLLYLHAMGPDMPISLRDIKRSPIA